MDIVLHQLGFPVRDSIVFPEVFAVLFPNIVLSFRCVSSGDTEAEEEEEEEEEEEGEGKGEEREKADITRYESQTQ